MPNSKFDTLRHNGSTVALACALLCIGTAAGWMGLVAHFDYGGNWTAFYRIGSRYPLPAAAAQEHLYLLPDSDGYDGQFYRLVAQDPLFLRGTGSSFDSPRHRYRHILVPALAWAAAFGRPEVATYTYIGVVLLFLGLGAFWLSRYAALIDRSPWWGLAFFLLPGVFLSVDNLTVDVALAAFTVGFALYWRAGSLGKLYVVLLLAPLTRETGFLLIAAYCLYAIFQKRLLQTVIMGTAGIPAALWHFYLLRHTPVPSNEWFQIPFHAAVQAMLRPESYPAFADFTWVIRPFYHLAWIGLVLAIVLAIARWNKDNPLCIAGVLFAVLAAVINYSVWQEVEAFGRVFTPLLILLPLAQPTRRSLIPLLAMFPRASMGPMLEIVNAFQAYVRH